MREKASFPPETVLFTDIHGYTLLSLIALRSIRWACFNPKENILEGNSS